MRFKPFLFHHEKTNGVQNATPLLGFEKMSVKLPLPKSWITFHIISHKQKRRKLLFLSQLFTTDLQWYSNVTSHIFNIPFLYLQIQFASKHDKLLTFSIWLQLYFIALVDERTIKMISVFEERYFLSLFKTACDWKRRHSYLTPTQISCTI